MENTDTSILSVKLFGTFIVKYRGETISDISPRAQYIWKLFRYLLINRGKFIPADNLIELLWKNDDISNASKALQNLIYRLRRLLPSKNETGEDYILFSHGSYGWNPRAKVSVDIFEFDGNVQRLKEQKLSESEMKELCQETIAYYTGDLLQDLSFEDWVEPFSTYYRKQYFYCVNTYLELLTNHRELDEIIDICTKAIQHNVFEEHYHACLIKAMLTQGNRYGALSHYESITALLLKELGVQPSSELIAAGKGIYSNDTPQSDFSAVVSEMADNNSIMGPLYCEADVFKQLFRLYERNTIRYHTPAYFVMLTVNLESEYAGDTKMLASIIAQVKRACIMSLRNTDIMSQYSRSQVLLLLLTATSKNIQGILDRIRAKYSALIKENYATIRFETRPIADENNLLS